MDVRYSKEDVIIEVYVTVAEKIYVEKYKKNLWTHCLLTGTTFHVSFDVYTYVVLKTMYEYIYRVGEMY